jgi:thiamine pyrophosphokinase
MIKGDLDSVRPDVRAFYASKGVAIKRDRSEYSTDLHKCIDEVESIESASGKRFSLLLFGGLSGRLDQTIGVMSTLLKLRTKRRDTYIISEESLAWVLDKGTHLIELDHSTMGQTCGILPVGVTEAYVRTEGLKWNLDWVTSLDGELSTSNHLLPSEPVVFLETTAPVFWTVEITDSLPPLTPSARSPALISPSAADELSRGVKEFGAGLARAAGGVAEVGKGLGRRLSTRQGGLGLNNSTGGGTSSNGDGREDWDRERDWDRDWDREREREKERAQLKHRQRETAGLVSAATATARMDSEDDGERYADGGYALLD